MFARTVVNLTLQSLQLFDMAVRHGIARDSPLLFDHLEKVTMIDDFFKD